MLLPALMFCALQAPAVVERTDTHYGSYLAHVAAAEANLRLGNLDEFRRWLDRAPQAHRGFEWRWLEAQRNQSLLARKDDLHWTTLALSPEGTRMALGDEKGTLILRETNSGKELWRIAAHGDEISWIDFDKAGERILTSSHDRKAKIFDARTGTLQLEFTKHGFPLGGAVFSPDEEMIASCSYERPPNAVVGTVHLWKTATGEVVKTLQGGRKPLSSIAFSPDGKTLAAGSWDFCVFLWDVEKGGEPRKFAMPEEGKYNAIDAIAFSPDGTKIVAGSKDDTARVWEIGSGNLLCTLRGHDNYLTSVMFSPDGSRLATGSADQTLRIWDSASGKPLAVLRGPLASVRAVAFTPDASLLWSATSDGAVHAWSSDTGLYGTTKLATGSSAYSCVFSPDGTRMASCSFDGRIQIWDAKSWDLLASWQAHPEKSSCHILAYSPDGRRLYSGSYDKTIGLWDALTARELGRLALEGGAYVGRLSPDGKYFAVGQTNRKIAVWDTQSRQQIFLSPAQTGSIADLAFSPNGVQLAFACDGGGAVLETSTGKEIAKLEPGRGTHAVLFSKDGEQLFVASSDRLLLAYESKSWKRSRSMPGGRNTAARLALSPDGKRLALGSRDTVLLDPEKGEITLAPRPFDSSIWFLEWSPTGEVLAVAAMNDGIGIFDPRPIASRQEERETARNARKKEQAWVENQRNQGRTLETLAEQIWEDSKLPKGLRESRLAAILAAASSNSRQ